MSDEPPVEPRVSADGRFFWDGSAWQPMPKPQASYPWTAGPWGCLGVLVIIGFLAAAGLVALLLSK